MRGANVQSKDLRAVGPFARAAALVVDELIRWTLILAGVYGLASIGVLGFANSLWVVLFVYGLYGASFDVLAAGQTPGKRSQGIAVVNSDGTPIRFGASLVRNALLLVDALPFAYLLGLTTMMVTRRFRRFGDLVSGALVVYRRTEYEPWEAADHGCVVVREAASTLYGAWCVTAVPIFLLLALLMWSSPATAGFALWWFKPLYERMPMWIARERMHGRSPTIREALSKWRELGAGLFAMLTYRRLSPTRSFDASIDVFERLRGSARRARATLLHHRSGTTALWLTVICAHIEAFFVTAAIVAMLWMTPHEIDSDWMSWVIAASGDRFEWASNLVYLVVIGLVGPMYAVAGFMLYANRLSELEGRPSLVPRPV